MDKKLKESFAEFHAFAAQYSFIKQQDLELPKLIAKLTGWISSSRNSFTAPRVEYTDLMKIRHYLLELREIKLKEIGIIK